MKRNQELCCEIAGPISIFHFLLLKTGQKQYREEGNFVTFLNETQVKYNPQAPKHGEVLPQHLRLCRRNKQRRPSVGRSQKALAKGHMLTKVHVLLYNNLCKSYSEGCHRQEDWKVKWYQEGPATENVRNIRKVTKLKFINFFK